jgi:hypothetical protein
MNVFEGSYMNSSYSAHAVHTNEYKFVTIAKKVAERYQQARAIKCG